jgi:predicted site-specific integrase-resolvase
MDRKNSLRNQLDTTPDYLDIYVVAKKLHVSANTLRNWISAGKLKGVKVFQIERTVRFERQSFFDFLNMNTREL